MSGLQATFGPLSIEEQFYLIWPALLLKAGIPRSRALALLGIAGVVVWRQIHWPLQGFEYVHTGMRLDAILCGSVMALYWPTLKTVIQRTSPLVMPAALVGFFAVNSWKNELQGATDLVQALLVCLLIACTVVFPGRLTSRIMENSAIAWVGKMSYSIYLWQQLFFFKGGSPNWQFPLRLLCIFLFAFLSYRFVERPLIAAGRRFLHPAQSKPPVDYSGSQEFNPRKKLRIEEQLALRRG
jgi:peptidoglycan/LPS O-acetylase OafA/YrhL